MRRHVLLLVALISCRGSESTEPQRSTRLGTLEGSQSEAAVTKTPIAGIFVNGIFNTKSEAEVSRLELEKVVSEAGLGSQLDMSLAYNTSTLYVSESVKRCYEFVVGTQSYFRLRSCGSVQKIASLLNVFPNQVEPEAQKLAEFIALEQASGRPVLLISHSQGTLMAIEALRILGNSQCVSIISLAGPLGKAGWSPYISESGISGFVVAGEIAKDVILYFGYNDFPQLATNLSREADKRLEPLNNPNLAVSHASVAFVYEDILLHGLKESYLAGVESRAKLRELIQKQVSRLSALCLMTSGEMD